MPTFAAAGVPYSRPVVVSKAAHDGLLYILNVTVRPLGSLTFGRNEYAVPTVAVVGGVPLTVSASPALASGEQSRESVVRTLRAPYRRQTAASWEEGIVTTPCRNPKIGFTRAANTPAAARVRIEPRRSRDGAAARWRLRSGSPAV